MSFKIKIFTEIIILTILLVFLPIIWSQFYVIPSSEKLSTDFRKFLNELVEIPQEVIIPEDFIRGAASTVWMIDDREVELAIDPDYQLPPDPVLLRIFLRSKELVNRQENSINLLPTVIIKDQRARKTVQELVTGSTVQFRQFVNQTDGLQEISVAFTDAPGYFADVEWDFERDNLPYGIGESFKQIDPKSSPLNRVAQILQLKPAGILISFLWILLPILIVAPLAYTLSLEISTMPSLVRFNILFLLPLAVFYAMIFFYFFR